MSSGQRRLCFVVQRYGREVAGGAETLCREVARRLASRYRLTVLTTCARDYLTWRNHYPAGETREEGLDLVRFPVLRERRVRSFGRLSVHLYRKPHPVSREMEWMEKQGPDSPGLLSYLDERRDDFDLFVFFTYLYPPTFFGLPRVAGRSVLVPMAHPEEPLKLFIFRSLFHLPRGFIFNTPEEQSLVVGRFDCGHIPAAVAGVGIEIPPEPVAPKDPGGEPYILYAGRLDVEKGLDELFSFFRAYRELRPARPLRLFLIGELKMRLPRHPDIRHLGYLPEEEKNRLIAGARALVVPSPHESLSIVALEAWARGRPVLANGRSEVLEGQCRRSDGGLFYRDAESFGRALDSLFDDPAGAAALGSRGREFVARTYSWETIEGIYTRFLDETLERVTRP
jgi:glycosyltransferase involved in cell wall biosynthesis